MSVDAINHAIAQTNLPPGPRYVLVILCHRAKPENNFGCWPSQKMIVADTGLSVASVARHLKFLEEANLITRQRRYRADGSRRSDYYTIVGVPKRPPIEHLDVGVDPAADARPTSHGDRDHPLTVRGYHCLPERKKKKGKNPYCGEPDFWNLSKEPTLPIPNPPSPAKKKKQKLNGTNPLPPALAKKPTLGKPPQVVQEFAALYQAWPGAKDWKPGLEKYAKIAKDGADSFADVLAGQKAYIADIERKRAARSDFTWPYCNLTVFLNQRRWEREYGEDDGATRIGGIAALRAKLAAGQAPI